MGIGSFILVFALALLLGMPIAFSMLFASALYFTINGADLLLQMLPERLFGGLDLFILLAIPMFLMAGDLMNRAGMSDRLITFANLLVGRLRGGLAQVNVLSSVLFSGVTGIALGDVVALGKIFIPAMERSGYSRSFAAAVTAASSLIGPIIPPSTIAVLYAAIMGVSVGGMFVAAIIPGLLIGLSDMIVVYLIARRRGYGVSSETVDRGKFLRSFRDALLAIVMPVIIIGGMLGGIFTPTEAAAVAVLYALMVGILVLRGLGPRDFVTTLRLSALDTARLLIIIGAAASVSWIFAIENVPLHVAALFEPLAAHPLLLVLCINFFFLFLGTWLDPAASIILFAPIVGPMAIEMGLHPLQFGVMMIVNANIGYVTPPIGNVLFAVSKIANVSTWALARELAPFIVVNALITLAVGLLPALSLWLPRLFGLA